MGNILYNFNLCIKTYTFASALVIQQQEVITALHLRSEGSYRFCFTTGTFCKERFRRKQPYQNVVRLTVASLFAKELVRPDSNRCFDFFNRQPSETFEDSIRLIIGRYLNFVVDCRILFLLDQHGERQKYPQLGCPTLPSFFSIRPVHWIRVLYRQRHFAKP